MGISFWYFWYNRPMLWRGGLGHTALPINAEKSMETSIDSGDFEEAQILFTKRGSSR
ncbi:hypothetical protein HNR39_000371 [Glaciimonas immobilis]|uniref:Uncharacterized protein n=1 Tax=Glaciimonas immobilis TaxID=728004 RepID=A0A840RPK6_9BURK|nr:hypothetical protein [Glaciimonas immobilis]